MAQSLGPAHPLYLNATAELRAAQANTRQQSEAVIGSISKEYEVARSTEAAIEEELASSRGNIQDLNRSQGSLNAHIGCLTITYLTNHNNVRVLS